MGYPILQHPNCACARHRGHGAEGVLIADAFGLDRADFALPAAVAG